MIEKFLISKIFTMLNAQKYRYQYFSKNKIG